MISRDKRVTDEEVEHFKEVMARFGNDTVVRCFECGRTQYLKFAYGLRNGWSKCCGGYTMTIVYMNTDIDKAVSGICQEAIGQATVCLHSKHTEG